MESGEKEREAVLKGTFELGPVFGEHAGCGVEDDVGWGKAIHPGSWGHK